MIGVNPPGHFLWDARTTGEQIQRYAALCADDASCRARTPDLAASIDSASGHMPDHWWFLPIRKGNVRLGAFFGLMHATTDGAGPLNGPWTIHTLLDAGNGDGSGAWLLSLMTQAIFPKAQVWGDVAAVARADAIYARGFFATGADRGPVIGSPGTDFYMAGGRLFDSWPASRDENQYTRVRDSKVETLLIGGRLDVATPPQNGTRELLPHLSRGHGVVLPDIGHTDDFWTYQTPASNRLINTYLDSGRVDTSLYTRTPVDFTPALSHGSIAEIVLGAMLALAALTVLSLIMMALRVRWRGPFGRKSSVVLRAAYPLVLGLGGLVLGILVVLTMNVGVAVTDELVVAVSVGLPIGLGVYLAWVNRESATPSNTGLAAAAAARPRRGVARIQRDGRWLRVPRTADGDRGGDRRCEPRPPRARHRVGLAGTGARVRQSADGGPRGAARDRLRIVGRTVIVALRAFAPEGHRLGRSPGSSAPSTTSTSCATPSSASGSSSRSAGIATAFVVVPATHWSRVGRPDTLAPCTGRSDSQSWRRQSSAPSWCRLPVPRAPTTSGTSSRRWTPGGGSRSPGRSATARSTRQTSPSRTARSN